MDPIRSRGPAPQRTPPTTTPARAQGHGPAAPPRSTRFDPSTTPLDPQSHGKIPTTVKALNAAIDAGDGERTLALLRGNDAQTNAALSTAYRERFGRDLEYDLRGFAVDPKGPIDRHGFSVRIRGLKGEELKSALEALHGPRVEQNAQRILELTASSTPESREELYRMLSLAGGEERTMLDDAIQARTGRPLAEVLKPVFAANQHAKPNTTPPEKTVAIVVSSGNWKDVAAGETNRHIGGYHWREVEAYVAEALERGYTPVIYTPDGLPPSPDALSLLQGQLGKVGFGLREGTGPDSPQGRAIMDAFAQARPLETLDPRSVATLHIAGGHGSHQDLVGNPKVEAAARQLHERGTVITAVCHATPSLGSLLEGANATGFSPQIDALNLKAGMVLPEFDPPYDAHEGLRQVGADFGKLDAAKAFANIHHTEVFTGRGAPIVTGTGPEATDDVARIALDWLAENPRR